MKKRLKRIYRATPQKSIIRNRFFWLFIFFLIISGTIFYFLIFFDKFQVKNIEILGNNKVSSEGIKNVVLNKINQKILFLNSESIFLASKKEITKEILDKYPAIDSVKIKKDFPDKLILEIQERKPFAVFCDQECFFIDEKGVIFEKKEGSLDNEIVIRFLNPSPLAKGEGLGQEVVEPAIISLISKIKKNLKDNFQIETKEALISLEKRLNIKTNENWQAFFSLESDIDLQITKLNLLLKEEIPPEKRKNLEYIDLRFTKVYYR